MPALIVIAPRPIRLVPKEIQASVLRWDELHPWHWLRETMPKPLLGS